MSDSQVLRAELEAARNFAKRYAALCARELLERSETGILPNGRESFFFATAATTTTFPLTQLKPACN